MSTCLDPTASRLAHRINRAGCRAKHAEFWAKGWRRACDKFAGVEQYEVRCSCGVHYSVAEYEALPEPPKGGLMVVPSGDDPHIAPAYRMQLRNCTECGSTISRYLDLWDLAKKSWVLVPDNFQP